MKNCDLHTHSYYSDGEYSPKELVRLAKKKGIKYLALTDHNSVEGIRSAINSGQKLGVEVIPGVEIISEWGEVLGYFIDTKNKELLELLKRNQKILDDVSSTCITKLKRLGIRISRKAVRKEFPRYPMMCFFVAQTLVKKKIIKSTSALYDEFIGKRFKLEYNLPKTENVIKIIKKARGIAILAHPFAESNCQKEFSNIKTLLKAGLGGIEIENGQYKHYDGKIRKQIIKISKKYNLILTKGSDYHGNNVDSKLGKSLCDEKVVLKMKKMVGR